MIPNFSDIKCFLEVADTKNISRASERLGVVQPTVTQAVKRLELAIGDRLFVRLKTGVQLTQAGFRFRAKAALLVKSWSNILTEAKSSKTSIQGVFTFGCHPSVAIYSLDKFLPKLVHDNPQLEIRLAHALSREILEKIVSFEVDFGLIVNPKRHPELVLRKLCTDFIGFWKSPSLLQHQTLIYDPNLQQAQYLIKKIRKQGSAFSKFIESSNLEVISSLAKAGLGVGILPERVAKPQGLKSLSPDFPVFQDELYLAYRADLQTTVASRAIISAISSAKI